MSTLDDLWRQVLEVDAVRESDHFFELGGNSFEALRLLDLIRSEIGPEVDLAEFFADPTVGGLRALVSGGRP